MNNLAKTLLLALGLSLSGLALTAQQAVPQPHPIGGGITKPAGGGHTPIHPIMPLKRTIRAELGLLLIQDQVSGIDYVTTLESRGQHVPGSWYQSLFGAKVPMPGASKPAVWYTHRSDDQVVRINQLLPAAAFVGVTDAKGNQLLSGQAGLTIPPQGPVNPVLSAQAFDHFVAMAVGGQQQLTMSQQLADGGERQLHTSLVKRGVLRLGPVNGPQCRAETIDGISGQVCTLRTVSGQHQATTAAGLKFTVQARQPIKEGRYRIAQRWHRLGEPANVAEFAQSRQIEVFLPPQSGPANQTKLAQRLQARFYSGLRQNMGDSLTLPLDNLGADHPATPVLGRVGVLLIDDQPSGRQYVTTLSRAGQQTIFGERQPQAGSKAIQWYPVADGGQHALNPLNRASQLQPPSYFQGLANAQGDMITSVQRPAYQGGYIFPVFSDAALARLLTAPLGSQQRLALQGEHAAGNPLPYQLNVSKQAQLTLQAPAGSLASQCRQAEVDGAAGQICTLRTLRAEHNNLGDADLRFRLQAKFPYALQAKARFRAGERWHPLNDTLPLAELLQGSQLELFVPARADQGGELAVSYAVTGEIYSQRRQAKGDRFTLNMPTRLSPPARLHTTLNLLQIEDTVGQQSYLTTLSPKAGEQLVGARPGTALPAASWRLAGSGSPLLSVESVTPVDLLVPQSVANGVLPLSLAGFERLLALPLGQPLATTLTAIRQNGVSFVQHTELRKAATLRWQAASGQCQPGQVAGQTGQICAVRQLELAGTINDPQLAFALQAPASLPAGLHYRLGGDWLAADKPHPLAALLTGSTTLELFVPNGVFPPSLDGIIVQLGLPIFNVSLGLDRGEENHQANAGTISVISCASENLCSGVSSETSRCYYGKSMSVDRTVYDDHGTPLNISTYDFNSGAITVLLRTNDRTGNPLVPYIGNSDMKLVSNGIVYTRNELGDLSLDPPIEKMIRTYGYSEICIGEFSRWVEWANENPNIPIIIASIEARGHAQHPDGGSTYANGQVGVNINTSDIRVPIPLSISTMSAIPDKPYAGQTSTVTITLSRAAQAGEKITIWLAGDSAAHLDEDLNPNLTAVSGVPDFDLTKDPGVDLALTAGASTVSFTLQTLDDGGTMPLSAYIKAKLTGTTVEKEAALMIQPNMQFSANPTTIEEGSSTEFTLTLSEPAKAGDVLSVGYTSSTISSADFDPLYAYDLEGLDATEMAFRKLNNDSDMSGATMVRLKAGATVVKFSLTAAKDQDGDGSEIFTTKVSLSRVPGVIKTANVTITPGADILKVTEINATPPAVEAGQQTKITMTLNRPARAGETLKLAFLKDSAELNDVSTTPVNLVGIYAFDLSETEQLAQLESGKTQVSFDIQTLADADTRSELFSITARGFQESGTVQDSVMISPAQIPFLVDQVVTSNVDAGISQKVSIKFNRAAPADSLLFLRYEQGEATLADVDPSLGFETGVSDMTLSYAGAAYQIAEGVDKISFALNTIEDTDTENESFAIVANIGAQSDSATLKRGYVTIYPKVTPPSISFIGAPSPVTGKFADGEPPMMLAYRVRVHNLARQQVAPQPRADRKTVAQYLQQRVASSYRAIAKVTMPSHEVTGTQYCAFTRVDPSNALVGLPMVFRFNGAMSPLNCTTASEVDMGDPATHAGWTHNLMEHDTSLELQFTMDSNVSKLDSNGVNWFGSAEARGSISLELRQ